ncbi:sensor domain-containing diguanylate cyclase [Syntrophus aciditrophicus]|jgi:diguanylate cyclase (GGDEF)-like protein/PAS domain S-box-containing protein|uniref:PAS sensory box/GGDEF family protein n=1 Tax=Syntrophus aciditrophicus (strain SB) TaxID=56780 RepID=Q2LTD8_SYNAS|nr:diguanylate cyclase [Syntrophus aciditrophicus]ABC77346.1 PAS sensory box/GGDEF family protein [Syntrophus aciditrophicus SB]OPY17485.1 MAG: putative diguanylate cyclase YegE [Syntrophus sp. PtaB.Bin075]
MFIDRDSYRRIVDDLYDGLYLVDRNRVIQYWNKAAERISGFTAAEVIGKSCSDNILTHVDRDGNTLCKGMCPLAMTIADGKTREAEVFLHHKEGYRMPVSVRVNTLTDADGNVIGGVELFTSRSSSRSIERRIRDLEKKAFYDNLTRLANRNCVENELQIRFEEQKRLGVSFGILFMDIDHFKEFNDTYGHDVGDLVLRFVADTLVKNARPSDLIGRWGGEEFIGILRNVTHENLEILGNRLRVLIENAYITLKTEQLHVSISVGATLMLDNDSSDTLLKRADMLLYESKRRGRNCLTIG